MNPELRAKIHESLSAVVPITVIVLALSIFVVPLDVGVVTMFFAGAVMLVVGMGMFQLGSEMAMTQLGEGIGVTLSKSKRTSIILVVSLFLGLLITIAEPDLQVLSNQVPSIPNHVIIMTVGIGVGIFLAVAVARIIFKINLSKLLIALYVALIMLTFFVPKDFLAVAFDSGGVTTGPITVPFIMAFGIGLSAIRSDKDASSDSFGLVAMSSVGPILAVLLFGLFFTPQDTVYEQSLPSDINTMQDVFRAYTADIPHHADEVAVSILPIVAVFAIFQLISRRYPGKQKLRVIIGFIYTYIGLVLFLCGVNVGFAPVGTLLGSALAATSRKWMLVPIGMLIGYFIVKAEPAIQILNHQVQTITNGTVSAKAMNRALSIGVSVSVGLAMFRILLGIPIQAIIIPGYIIALAMSRFVPKIFVGIAFDSGGVASGPMTSTFLLPLCIGACEATGGNIMTDAFGVVALVALTPLIAIQIMGIAYQLRLRKARKIVAGEALLPQDSDDIILIEEVQA